MVRDVFGALILSTFCVLTARAADDRGIAGCEALLGEATVEVELRITEKGKLTLTPEAEGILALLTLDQGAPARAFERASPRAQRDLIRRRLKEPSAPYHEDRRIPGLRLRPTVRLRWTRPTRFLNVEYAPNVGHEVALTPLLGSPDVELGAPAARATGGFVEVHLRSATLSPGQLVRETWTLLEGLGISQDKAHVHVVVPIARARLASAGERFGLVNGYRYLNLAAELISILYKNRSIKTDRPASWGALHGRKLSRLMSHLAAYAADGTMPEPDRFKMSYVGFHFPNKYDGLGNFGLQFRSVDRRTSDQMATLLDDGRAFLRRASWIEPNQAAWLAKHQWTPSWPLLMGSLWHREDTYQPDSEGAPPLIRDQLMADEGLRHVIEETGVHLYEAQMLTYDWARDPLYFGDDVAIEALSRCQERAFGRFAAAREYRLEFTQEFLRCAGIYERVRRRLRAPPLAR